MRNRAKCKLCKDVLESFHEFDMVGCKCGHISISGGQMRFEASAIDWGNFLRVDDEGNEILVKVQDEPLGKSEQLKEDPKTLTKLELIDMLDEMCKSYENLPSAAMQLPVSNADLYSALLLLSSIFRA